MAQSSSVMKFLKEKMKKKEEANKNKKFALKNQCTKSHLCDIKLACFDIL